MPLANAHGLNACRLQFRLEGPRIKMHHMDLEAALRGQSLCQGDKLTLSSSVTEVTDQEGQSA